jgi:DNA-binding transcriptional LysR family regulator
VRSDCHLASQRHFDCRTDDSDYIGVTPGDKSPVRGLIVSAGETMDRFLEMETFVRVVDAGSFVHAAEPLGLSKAAVSRHLAALEARLGVRLLNRTTRRISLTDEGALFYARCVDLLGNVESAESEITSRAGEAAGLLRISAPVSFGILHLSDAWAAFKARHPKVTFNITLTDRVVDLVEEGLDLAIRINRLRDSTLVSRRLAETRVVACASPRYLKRHGTPKHPGELTGHAIIAYSLWSMQDEWEFEGPEGRVAVRTVPCIRTNSGDTCRACALAHEGIILQPTFLVGEDLAEGRLVELFPQYRAATLGVYAVYGSRMHLATKVRVMIDFLAKRFEKRRWPD